MKTGTYPLDHSDPLSWGAYGYALLGVLIFSFTLPMSRLAVAEYDPWLIGMLRSSISGVLAIAILFVTRSARLSVTHLPYVLYAAAGGLGWSVFSNLALQTVPSSQAAVLIGIIPLFTAIFAALSGERALSLRFWGLSIAGTFLIVAYAMGMNQGQLHLGHLYLLIGSMFSGICYAYGGKASKYLGGWQTICWSQALSLPLTLPVSWYLARSLTAWGSPIANLSVLYLALMSSLIGFFPWYKAMAIGNVAKIGQVQLLQPFLAILISAIWLKEQVGIETWLSCIVIVLIIAASRKS